jgi:hypothetical protein
MTLVAPPSADLTATATLILAGITVALVVATIALVVATRAGNAQARADAGKELRLLRRQFSADRRPLLVDVLTTAPVPPDMGASENAEGTEGLHRVIRYPGPTIETRLPGFEARLIDPRTPFVAVQAGKIYVSVPLRNVGRGIAVIDGGSVAIEGPGVGVAEYRAVQRPHVPVNETTRVDLIIGYRHDEIDRHDEITTTEGIAWSLQVPYTDFAGEQPTAVVMTLVCRGEDLRGPWLVERVDQRSALAPPSHATEPPETDEPERPVRAPQQITDLWGNPIMKRGKPPPG